MVWEYHEVLIKRFCTKGSIVRICVAFMAFYLFSRWSGRLDFWLEARETLWGKGIYYVVHSAVSLIVTMLGVGVVYLSVNYFVEKRQYVPTRWVFEASAICYGVYIFQQFVLQFLYYKTSLPVLVGPYWLPWVGCVVTFVVSILLTRLMLKTRFGRFLIG